MNVELLDQLDTTIRTVSTDPAARVLVVTGDEIAFSTGADLKTLLAALNDLPRLVDFLNKIHDTFCALESAPLPTIAMVRGFALAGGLELLLCCDMAIASDDATIGDQHSNYGLMDGGGGIPRLIRRIGLQAALEIIFTGRWLSGKEAAESGIVLRSVPARQLESEVLALARQLTSKSRSGLRYIKRAARAALDLPQAGALRAEQAAFIEYFISSGDPRSGLDAFVSKQRPIFNE